jgi:hypothetical protein
MFRSRPRRSDPLWQVAASTQVFAADRATVDILTRQVEAEDVDLVYDGLLIARPHPTGWFLWAVRRDDLHQEALGHFRELVTVRAFVLLSQGPVPRLWTPMPVGHPEWRSPAPSLSAELSEA